MSPAPLVRSRQAPRAGAISGEPAVGGTGLVPGTRAGRVAALRAGLGNTQVAESGAKAEAPARPVDQRRAVRRASLGDRSKAFSVHENTGRNWIPRRWPYLILSMIATVLTCMVATRSLPGPVIGSMLGVSIALSACVGLTH